MKVVTFYQVVYCVKGVRPVVMASFEDLKLAQKHLKEFNSEQYGMVGKFKIKSKTVEFS